MKQRLWSVCLIPMAFACLTASLSVQAQSSSRQDYVLLEKEAILLLPAEMVGGQGVINAQWIPNGQGLLLFQQPPQLRPQAPSAEMRVAVWQTATRRSREIWKRTFPAPPSGAAALTWLATTQTAVTTLRWQEMHKTPQADGTIQETWSDHQEILWTDTQRGQVLEIPVHAQEILTLSPTQPQGVLYNSVRVATPSQTLRVLRPDGSLSAPVTLPMDGQLNDVRWSSDGKKLLLLLIQRGPEKSGINARWFAFDPVSGESSLWPAPGSPATFLPQPQQGRLQLKRASSRLKEGETSVPVRPLWLEATVSSDKSRALICADGEQGQISPRQDAVLYLSEQAAWVRSFLRMPKETFIAAIQKAQHQVALSNARQLGLGLFLWAQDHEDGLPMPGNTVGDLLPYLQNESLFDGFTYLYSGGPLADIANPSQTAIGSVDWSGGTVFIFADGSVRDKK